MKNKLSKQKYINNKNEQKIYKNDNKTKLK